ncbi:hypothetical protein Q7C36_013608 [Tachysurus vachellii]|uniref:Uncharacterized protein n=1 Tax=Tachysurus vachellii TaxID=175792 RepID=A0AA88ML95_TACVA|nr:hypothetical protein Q7C36_013608 [Tachysurus vachellii]
MRTFTPFSPAWCSLNHLSASQANESCGEKKQKQPESKPILQCLRIVLSVHLIATSAQFLMCFTQMHSTVDLQCLSNNPMHFKACFTGLFKAMLFRLRSCLL